LLHRWVESSLAEVVFWFRAINSDEIIDALIGFGVNAKKLEVHPGDDHFKVLLDQKPIVASNESSINLASRFGFWHLRMQTRFVFSEDRTALCG